MLFVFLTVFFLGAYLYDLKISGKVISREELNESLSRILGNRSDGITNSCGDGFCNYSLNESCSSCKQDCGNCLNASEIIANSSNNVSSNLPSGISSGGSSGGGGGGGSSGGSESPSDETPISNSTIPANYSSNKWYVSKNGNNNGGTSWTNAWNELDQINWNLINPGDTIYIDGGEKEMNYSSKLETSKSGNSNGYIIITRSEENGHNGIVKINSQIKLYSSYISLDGVDKDKFFISAIDSMAAVFVGYSSVDAHHIVLANFTSNYLTYPPPTEYGIPVRIYADNSVVRNCKIVGTIGEDQMSVDSTGDVMIENCEFTGQKDSGTVVHRDVISVYPGTLPGKKLTIRNNYFHDSETDTIIIIPDEGAVLGKFEIENNIWWNVDTCIKFDSSRIYSTESIMISGNKFGNYSTWISTNGGCADSGKCIITENSNTEIFSKPF